MIFLTSSDQKFSGFWWFEGEHDTFEGNKHRQSTAIVETRRGWKFHVQKVLGTHRDSSQWHRWLQVTREVKYGVRGTEVRGLDGGGTMVWSTKTCSIDRSRRDTSSEHGFTIGTNQERLWISHEVGEVNTPLDHTQPSPSQHPHLSPVPLHETFRDVPGSCRPWNHAQSTYLDESCRVSTLWWLRPSWNHPNQRQP